MRIAISGLSGFIGRTVESAARNCGNDIVALDRAALAGASDPAFKAADRARIEALVRGCDAVIHLAGLAHRRGIAAQHHDAVNHLLSVRLGECARASGLRRFTFVSSLSVYGHVAGSRRIDPLTPLGPTNPYGTAKAKAEEGLAAQASGGAFEVVILRPPLVCGAGAPGNLAALRRAVVRGFPLPDIRDNKRDLLGVRNLALALLQSLEAPMSAPVMALPLADGTPLSTGEIIREIARGTGRVPRLLPVPRLIRRIAGQIPAVDRSLGPLWHSLEIDTVAAWSWLGTSPARTTREELFAVGAGRA